MHICFCLFMCFPSAYVSHVCLCMHKSTCMVYLFAGIYLCTFVCTRLPSMSNTYYECRPTNVYVSIIDDAVYLFLYKYTHLNISDRLSTKLARTRNSCLFLKYFTNTYGENVPFWLVCLCVAILKKVTQTIKQALPCARLCVCVCVCVCVCECVCERETERERVSVYGPK